MTDNIHPQIHLRIKDGRLIPLVEWEGMRLNSYERAAVLHLLSVEALAADVANTLKNCNHIRQPAATYEDHAVADLVPELLARLQEATSAAAALASNSSEDLDEGARYNVTKQLKRAGLEVSL